MQNIGHLHKQNIETFPVILCEQNLKNTNVMQIWHKSASTANIVSFTICRCSNKDYLQNRGCQWGIPYNVSTCLFLNIAKQLC